MSKEKWVAIGDTINLIDDHIEIRNCCAEYVCNKLNEKDQRIKELEEQLNEKCGQLQQVYSRLGVEAFGEDIHEQALKELGKSIFLKFDLGQEIWGTRPFRSWKVKEIELKEIDGMLWEVYRLTHDNTDDYNCCIIPVENDRFFATKEEAEAKLKEIK